MASNDAGARRESASPLVVMEGVSKRFPGVLANDDVTIDLRKGEVHALIGENGAGKSTLMRVLYGLYPPDGGTIRVKGEVVKIASPRDAISLGIGMVHQHFVLVDPFTVAENIILGDEGGPILHTEAAELQVAQLADAYGFHIEPAAPVEDLSVGEEQRVEILKALYRGVDILILDEPTAVLTPAETQELFENLRKLREDGKTIVFISHKLDEVLAIADRITVLRRGAVVGETTPAETNKAKLAEMMVGRPVLFRLEKPQVEVGEAVLRLDDLRGGRLQGLSLEVRAGEIVGVAGVEGNGQKELADSIMGLRPLEGGEVALDGHDLRAMSTQEIRNSGVAFVPEDRHDQGLVLDMTIWENTVIGRHDDSDFSSRRGVLFIKRMKELARRLIAAVRRTHPQYRVDGPHAVGRQPTEADPRTRARDRSEAAARRPTHSRTRRRGDRVRVEPDPGAEGRRSSGAVDLGGARRDLRAL